MKYCAFEKKEYIYRYEIDYGVSGLSLLHAGLL